MDPEARRVLGAFLRSRRERLRPELVGLPAGVRRRTPGLRREEIAQLASVSVTWYTWMEQGRAVSVTGPVMASVARALQLSAAERAYLFTLACVPPAGETPATTPVSQALRQLVEHQQPFPAYLMDRSWDVLAINAAAIDLFGAFDTPAGGSPNMLWYTFTSPEARRRIVDWDARAQRLLAEFRGDCRDYLTEPWLVAFVERLCTASPQFARWWAEHNVYGRDGGQRAFRHPDGHELVFEQLTLFPSANRDHKLVIHVPLSQPAVEERRSSTAAEEQATVHAGSGSVEATCAL
jgi:transcriptional regulator with XRE-family HTH domain